MTPQDIERFWSKVHKTDGCWEWTAGLFSSGYGAFRVGGKNGQNRGAHRLAYRLLVGPIPEGLQLDHLCRNRACVNPAHLEAVTCRENLLRGETIAANLAARTHCPQGHPLAGTNLYRSPKGARVCLMCKRERNRVYMRTHRRANIDQALRKAFPHPEASASVQ